MINLGEGIFENYSSLYSNIQINLLHVGVGRLNILPFKTFILFLHIHNTFLPGVPEIMSVYEPYEPSCKRTLFLEHPVYCINLKSHS